jgi:hypothetical protein
MSLGIKDLGKSPRSGAVSVYRERDDPWRRLLLLPFERDTLVGLFIAPGCSSCALATVEWVTMV